MQPPASKVAWLYLSTVRVQIANARVNRHSDLVPVSARISLHLSRRSKPSITFMSNTSKTARNKLQRPMKKRIVASLAQDPCTTYAEYVSRSVMIPVSIASSTPDAYFGRKAFWMNTSKKHSIFPCSVNNPKCAKVGFFGSKAKSISLDTAKGLQSLNKLRSKSRPGVASSSRFTFCFSRSRRCTLVELECPPQ